MFRNTTQLKDMRMVKSSWMPYFKSSCPRLSARRQVKVAADTGTQPKQSEEKQKKLITEIEEGLKKSGVDKNTALKILNDWKQATKENQLSPEAFRKIMVKQSSIAVGLVAFQILLDCGAAYGAFTLGSLLGANTEQWGFGAVIGQAIAFFLAGYYVSGAFFDLFKLGALTVAAFQFNVNAPAFLAAVQDLAGNTGTGLTAVDKATEAVNTVKVLNALREVSDKLQRERAVRPDASAADMLSDLAAYLTLDKAQKAYGFDAEKLGITDDQAADIAVVFSAFDKNDDGVINLDEFKQVCAKYAPELTDEEVSAALMLLDKDKSGSINFAEFVDWWLKRV